jgi:hypothetical protein
MHGECHEPRKSVLLEKYGINTEPKKTRNVEHIDAVAISKAGATPLTERKDR